jgi:Ca2+-binding EF-hand superfamily protein
MIKEIFSEVFDKDGDGIITKEEFRTGIGHMASMLMQLAP